MDRRCLGSCKGGCERDGVGCERDGVWCEGKGRSVGDDGRVCVRDV